MQRGTIVFFSVLLLAALGYGLVPSWTVVLKGLRGEMVTGTYDIRVRSQGAVTQQYGIKVQDEPPYELRLTVLPQDETVAYVELQDVLVYACGTTSKLYTYDAPLVHTVDYYDYRPPLARYELRGTVPCHENVIMDLALTLRDSGQRIVATGNERLLVSAYEYRPSTIGYWWSMVWDR